MKSYKEKAIPVNGSIFQGINIAFCKGGADLKLIYRDSDKFGSFINFYKIPQGVTLFANINEAEPFLAQGVDLLHSAVFSIKKVGKAHLCNCPAGECFHVLYEGGNATRRKYFTAAGAGTLAGNCHKAP